MQTVYYTIFFFFFSDKYVRGSVYNISNETGDLRKHLNGIFKTYGSHSLNEELELT